MGGKAKEQKSESSAGAAASETKQVSTADRERLVKEAVADILKGIADPETQKNGGPFVPLGWHTKYAPALGKYKKFVVSQTDTLGIVEQANGAFRIVRAADAPPSTPGAV